ncbi:MAG: thioredoxin domain-containing protein, partial [Deltaproteobacteria bacterium]|nr:thioredoxin domain-containing protein [Deltaproteobacteria bacterium]
MRIDALEKRIAALEAGPQSPPAQKPKDPAALEEKIEDLQARVADLQVQLAKRPTQPPPAAPKPPRAGALDPAQHYLVPVDDSPSVGPAAAPVTMVAAVQFPEPYTHKAWPVIVQLHRDYPKDLRIVFKGFVVHQKASASTIGACAAGHQRRLDKMEDAIYTAASDGGGLREVTDGELRELARGLRLDLKQYDRDVTRCTAAVTRDALMFAKLGQNGVPTFWINGRPLSGAQPIEAFRTVIDEERTAAADDKARGGK